jgi:hypothetical protein
MENMTLEIFTENIKTRKLNRKNYIELYEVRKDLKYAHGLAQSEGDFPYYHELKQKLDVLNKEFFDKLPTQNVAYTIGARGYYEEVVKLGKSYFQYGKAMTEGRGYFNIKEIKEINDEMKQEMIEDTYYY